MPNTQEIRPKLLFLTLPDLGQANVHLAVLQELRAAHPDASLHLGSYPPLALRAPSGVTFHPIAGKGPGQRLTDLAPAIAKDTRIAHSFYAAPGLWGTISGAVRLVVWSIHPETPAETVPLIRSVESVIETVDPDVVVVDALFSHAADAAQRLRRKYVILSPNTLKDVATEAQGAAVFKLPCVNTGYPYPVPWYLFVQNVICYLFLALYTSVSPAAKAIVKVRNAAGYSGGLPMFSPRQAPVLCMSVPELEYPMVVPPSVTPCGPILLPSPPLIETDPELATWVSRRPTVLIVLGSHFVQDPDHATATLRAINALFSKRSDVQVLWKWRNIGNWELPGADALGDRLRIVNWMKADPTSVLRHGIVCSVNHGGSNSYHEALASGTPQVIVSPWFDCHDMGVKAEWLGVGVWGNRHHAPHCDADEFGRALLAVVGEGPGDPSACAYKRRAEEVAAIVGAYRAGKEGRVVAAEYLWEAAQNAITAKAET